MPAAQVKSGVEQVRKALPGNVSLWIGGAGVQRQRYVEPGIQVMGPLSDLTDAVIAWREAVATRNA
jgi:hypothetical protein